MASDNSGNLAVLIDGDNVSPKIIAGLMAEIANYGTASVRRIYADWTSPLMNGWKACLLDYSIIPIQQFAYTTGKNATDGAMIIDAMDLLYTSRFSSFCLVSSDSDFTRLAARIREQGVTVYGFGERKTNNAFIAACDKFVYFDVLNVPVGEPDVPKFAAPPSTLPAHKAVSSLGEAVIRPRPPLFSAQPSPRPLDQAALDGLRKAIISTSRYDGHYANLAEVGHFLSKISPDLNARNYGYERLREFVEASGIVNLKYKDMGNNPPVVLVSLKESNSDPTTLPWRR